MNEVVHYKYQVTYYVEFEQVPLQVLSKMKIEESRLLHQTYIPLHNEIFEPINKSYSNYNVIVYARYLAIERVKNYERIQCGQPLQHESVHKGLLINDFYEAEFEIVKIAKKWKVLLKDVFAVIRFQDIQIYGKIKTGAFQIYELVEEFKKISKLNTYVLEGHSISECKKILKEDVDFLLAKNDSYRFIFYRVELEIINGNKTKHIIKDFRSKDSLKNREKALLFLATFYQGLFFDQEIFKEPQQGHEYRKACYIKRKLFSVPCPFWRRNADFTDLISVYEPILFENSFHRQWDLKDKLEDELTMFEKFWINTKQSETTIRETEKGVFEHIHYSEDGSRHEMVYFPEEYASYDILKGSKIILTGKFI